MSKESMMRALAALLALTLSTAAADSTETAVSKLLRDLIIQKLPSPALETRHNWDHKKEVVVGWDIERRGRLDWIRTPRKELKNDSLWTHLVVTLKDPAKNLNFQIEDLKPSDGGRIAFTAKLQSSDVHLKFEQRIWKRGVRVMSNETRATCQAAVHMQCVLGRRLEADPGTSLPAVVLKLNVTKAEIYYDKLMVEHTLGVGGDAAKIIGETTHKLLTQIKPNLERDLIAKANAAIVKAANDKEVRVGLEGLLKK